MMDRFDGEVGVVTGGASGIGREVALELSARGMRLALADVDAEGLAETISLTTDPGRHRAFTVDVADAAAVDAAAAQIVADMGTPALLVNSAGQLGPHRPAVWELAPQDWTTVFGANLYGSVNFARALVPVMQAAARPAHIVVIASIVGLVADDRMGAYTAAKHALVSFAETLRLELAAREAEIGVTLVCPGGVPTNLNAALRAVAARSAPADWLTAGEVAKKIIEAVCRGDFYVFTHAASKDRIRRYHESVLGAPVR